MRITKKVTWLLTTLLLTLTNIMFVSADVVQSSALDITESISIHDKTASELNSGIVSATFSSDMEDMGVIFYDSEGNKIPVESSSVTFSKNLSRATGRYVQITARFPVYYGMVIYGTVDHDGYSCNQAMSFAGYSGNLYTYTGTHWMDH